jgi:ketosteroid isomerase-like protein
MNAQRVLSFPMIGLMIVALILLAVGGFAVLMSVTWSFIHTSQSPIQADPLEMVDVFHPAINNDDVDAMLDLFADDAVVIDNESVIEGKEQIRNWVVYSQRMAGLRLIMLSSEMHGDKVTWIDTAHNGPEEEDRVSLLRWTAVIQKGKIKSLTVSFLPMPDGK